jgi:hypothetical protein
MATFSTEDLDALRNLAESADPHSVYIRRTHLEAKVEELLHQVDEKRRLWQEALVRFQAPELETGRMPNGGTHITFTDSPELEEVERLRSDYIKAQDQYTSLTILRLKKGQQESTWVGFPIEWENR